MIFGLSNKSNCGKIRFNSQKENYDPEVNAGICYEWDKEALEYIIKIADGGMRDAITLLDKCLSYSGDITVENVVNATRGNRLWCNV